MRKTTSEDEVSYQILLTIHYNTRTGTLSGILLRRIKNNMIPTTNISKHIRLRGLNHVTNLPIVEDLKEAELMLDILSLGTIVLPKVERPPELLLSTFLPLSGVNVYSGIWRIL